MLLSFKVKNYLSFLEEAEFSLLPSTSDKTHMENMASDKPQALKSAIIYGPNASGKSNFFRALKMFCMFICHSDGVHENAGTPFKSFVLDKEASRSPSEFEIIFNHEGNRYRYGFSADNKIVHEEWLFVAGKGKERFVFERTLKNDSHEYEFGPSGRKFKRLIKEDRIRKNALLISVGSQFNIVDAKFVVKFLSSIVFFREEDGISSENVNLLSSVVKFADLGIYNISADKFNIEKDLNKKSGIRILGKIDPSDKTVSFTEAFKDMMLYSFKYQCADGSFVDMYEAEQSDGTLHFMGVVDKIISVYKTGGVLLVDEIEKSLHPFLCEALFSVLHKLPKDKVQMICTTHSTEIINADIFRRDQIWIAEKNNFGRSTLTSLDEYKVRNSAKLGKQYLEGRFRGVPILNLKFFDEFISTISALDREDGDA